MRGHCCMPQPCPLTLFSCTLVFSSVGHFLDYVLESNFGRRIKPSGTALRKLPFFMEMLLWRPPLSQKCPLPIPVSNHKPATPQDCDQAARALRSYSNTRAQKKRVEVEREQLRNTKLWYSLAVLPCQESLPFHLCMQELSCSSKNALEEGCQKKKFTAGPFIFV